MMARQTAAERADLEGAAGVTLNEALEAEEADAAVLEGDAEDLEGADDLEGAEDLEAEEQAGAAKVWHGITAAERPPAGPLGSEEWSWDIPEQVKRYLKPDETRVIATRKHMVRLIMPALALAGGLAAAIALNGWAYETHHARPMVVHVIWFAFLACAAYAVYGYAEWRQTWFVITGHRIMLIESTHLFGRDITMLPISKMRDLAYRQTALGRFLGYATFDFASIGTEKALDLVPFLPWPEWLYQRVSELTMPSNEGKVIKRHN
jgi:hypothetical protein